MTKENKFEFILSNSINGNLTDFRKAVKKLNKLSLLEFIEYSQGQGVERHLIINKIRLALE